MAAGSSIGGKYLQAQSQFPGKGPCYPVWASTVPYFNRCVACSCVVIRAMHLPVAVGLHCVHCQSFKTVVPNAGVVYIAVAMRHKTASMLPAPCHNNTCLLLLQVLPQVP